MVFVLVVGLWTSSILSAVSLRVHDNLLNQATCFVELEKAFDLVPWGILRRVP